MTVVVLIVLSAPLAGSLVLGIRQAHATAVNMGVLNILERDGRNKALGLPSLVDLAVELVDLLEGKTLGFVDQGPDEKDTDEAASTPQEEDLDTHVGVAWARVNHVGRGVADGKVEEPVGGSRHGKGLGADLERENLTSDDPGDWAPRAGEEEDVDADKGNQRSLRRHVVCTSNGADNRNDELGDGHTNGTKQEKVTATPLVGEVKTRDCGNSVDARRNHGDDKGVPDARVLEEGGSVVENEVDTSELLEGLKTAASCKTLAKVALEAVDVTSLAQSQLVLVVGGDLTKLLNQCRVVDRKLPEPGQRPGSLLWVTILNVPSRCFWKHNATGKQDNRPGELNGNGDAVGSTVVAVLGCIVDNGCKKKTYGDGQLVATDNETTDPLGTGFRLVERNGCTDHTDSESSKHTTNDKKRLRCGGSLKDDSNTEDDVGNNKTEHTTKKVGSRSGSQSPKESTSRQDRNNQRLFARSNVQIVVLGIDKSSAEFFSPIRHGKNTTDSSGIITADVSETCSSVQCLKTTYP